MALRELNEKWDKSLGIIFISGLKGAFAGTLIGLALFKRRSSCISYFTGLGLGYGSVESEFLLNSPAEINPSKNY